MRSLGTEACLACGSFKDVLLRAVKARFHEHYRNMARVGRFSTMTQLWQVTVEPNLGTLRASCFKSLGDGRRLLPRQVVRLSNAACHWQTARSRSEHGIIHQKHKGWIAYGYGVGCCWLADVKNRTDDMRLEAGHS